jgi:hypothetical protein
MVGVRNRIRWIYQIRKAAEMREEIQGSTNIKGG